MKGCIDMSKPKYYDGTKLLSLQDINGNKPEIYIVTTNRTGGKTVYFTRMLINKFKKTGEKFAMLYRYNYELDECADKMFKDVGSLFFQGDTLTSKRKASGIFHELYLNDEPCGYAISLNSSDQLKKYSHLFSDVERIMMDEFQTESGKYCTDEVTKLISIHTSIARGQGEQVRYVPTFLIGNPVTLINPYYVALGISERLRSDTNFLKGDGWVMEQGFNETASESQKNSGFNRAFSSNEYVIYSSQGVYLNDNTSFIDKPTGSGRYIATIKYKGVDYGIREYINDGILYCDNKCDNTYPVKITVSADDHQINYVMLKRNDLFLSNLRFYFEKGCFRFKNLQCKEAVLKALSY